MDNNNNPLEFAEVKIKNLSDTSNVVLKYSDFTDADWNSQRDTRQLGLSLSCRFGKAKN